MATNETQVYRVGVTHLSEAPAETLINHKHVVDLYAAAGEGDSLLFTLGTPAGVDDATLASMMDVVKAALAQCNYPADEDETRSHTVRYRELNVVPTDEVPPDTPVYTGNEAGGKKK